MVNPLLEQLPKKCVLDAEIVISRNGALDFDALQLRIHPATSRVKLFSQQTPTSIIFFDLLAEGNHDWREEAFSERREKLRSTLAGAKPPIHLTPVTDDLVARDWFQCFEGAGLDGVIAKATDSIYESDKRTMFKEKYATAWVTAVDTQYRQPISGLNSWICGRRHLVKAHLVELHLRIVHHFN